MMDKGQESSFKPDQIIAGRYKIVSLLDIGGMGEVYRAQDLDLGRIVALKTLRASLINEAEIVERFNREGRAAAQIDHPGIVQVFDRGLENDQPFVVMELLHGEDLRTRICSEQHLVVGWVARIGGDLAHAVRAAHKKGIIHRDLKPSNVFLQQNGPYPDMVKILDFGVAKLVDASFTITRTTQVLGTPVYMAPEQIRSSKQAREAADIYSIGCILYELLTKQPPFAANNRPELTMKILNDPPESIEIYRPDIPQVFCSIIYRAMAKDPEQRHSSAAQLARELYQVADRLGEMLPIAPTDSLYPPSHPELGTTATVLSSPSPSVIGRSPIQDSAAKQSTISSFTNASKTGQTTDVSGQTHTTGSAPTISVNRQQLLSQDTSRLSHKNAETPADQGEEKQLMGTRTPRTLILALGFIMALFIAIALLVVF